MTNPNKYWSWRGNLGRAVGAGAAGAAGGALAGAVGGPLGIGAGAAALGAIGFAGGFIGGALGHLLDDLIRPVKSFGSGVLFTLVASGILNFIFVLLALAHITAKSDAGLVLEILSAWAGFIGAALKSLIDDLHAAYSGRNDPQSLEKYG